MPCTSGSCGDSSTLGSSAELGFAPEIRRPVDEAEIGMSGSGGLGALRGRSLEMSPGRFAQAVSELRAVLGRHSTIDIVERPVFGESATAGCAGGALDCWRPHEVKDDVLKFTAIPDYVTDYTFGGTHAETMPYFQRARDEPAAGVNLQSSPPYYQWGPTVVRICCKYCEHGGEEAAGNKVVYYKTAFCASQDIEQCCREANDGDGGYCGYLTSECPADPPIPPVGESPPIIVWRPVACCGPDRAGNQRDPRNCFYIALYDSSYGLGAGHASIGESMDDQYGYYAKDGWHWELQNPAGLDSVYKCCCLSSLEMAEFAIRMQQIRLAAREGRLGAYEERNPILGRVALMVTGATCATHAVMPAAGLGCPDLSAVGEFEPHRH